MLDARTKKSIIKKKTKDELLTSVIPDSRRLAYKPPSNIDILAQKLWKTIIKPVHAQTTVVKTIGSASRNFSCIQGTGCWEESQSGNLVTRDTIEEGWLYNDSTFSVSSTQVILGSTTDATHYMKLTVAPSERHKGIRATGVVITVSTTGFAAFQLRDNYTRLEWVDIKGVTSDDSITMGAASTTITGIILQNFIIRDYNPAAGAINAIRFANGQTATSITIRNCIIYPNGTTGTRRNIRGDATAGNADTVTVENCTLYGGTHGIQESTSTFTAKNTIAMSNSTSDFVVTTQDYNMSSDATANCGTCLPSKTPANQFVSTTSGSEDFHLKSGSDAINAGTDLSANFDSDIDEGRRPQGAAWDIGADEFQMSLVDIEMRHGKYFLNNAEQPFRF